MASNPFSRFFRDLRFFSYSYNFERDHVKKSLRLILGTGLLAFGVVLTVFSATREMLTPYVTSGVALFGVFLLLTADDSVLSRREMVMLPLEPELLEQARTTGSYSGFGIEGGHYYLYSRNVNQMLMRQDRDLYATMDPRPFALDADLRRLAPFILDSSLTPSGKRLFNKEVRLESDITEAVFRSGEKVVLQPTDYVSGLCTNEIALKQVRQRSNDKVLVRGLDLFLEDRVVRDLDGSRCANLIGINSLVMLADGHMLIREQTKPYAQNFGQLIPFVSSSLNMEDYNASLSLQQMVAKAMTRRLMDETGYRNQEAVHTAVIGYVRMLKRGGKPEFLAVTFIADRLENVLTEDAIKRHEIRMPYMVHRDRFTTLSEVRFEAETFRKAHEAELSTQMAATFHAMEMAMSDEAIRGLLSRSLGLQA